MVLMLAQMIMINVLPPKKDNNKNEHIQINKETKRQQKIVKRKKNHSTEEEKQRGRETKPMNHPLEEEKFSGISLSIVYAHVCMCVAFEYLLFLWVDISFLVYCTTYGFVCFV